MKKIFIYLFLLFNIFIFSGCSGNELYLDGEYYGECIYRQSNSTTKYQYPMPKKFTFEDNRFDNVECIDIGRDDFFLRSLPNSSFYVRISSEGISNVKTINYYIIRKIANNSFEAYYIFKADGKIFLFDVICEDGFYEVLSGYSLIDNDLVSLDEKINTSANFTFIPEKRSDLNSKEIKQTYEAYLVEKNLDRSSYGEYNIYNYSSEYLYNRYSLDIVQIQYQTYSYYYIKHKGSLYSISSSGSNYNWFNHLAITDANNDGYIEIFTAVNSYSDEPNWSYCTSDIKVIDTKTKDSITAYDYRTLNYFKENEEGVISIYNTNEVIPNATDIQDGILDARYYDLATNLFDTPVLNTSKYTFKKSYVEASCKLFKAEVTIEDSLEKFPYLFNAFFANPNFKVTVKMTYLGKTFSYTSGDSYLDGATVSFVNKNTTIDGGGGFGLSVISPFVIFTGMEIEKTYNYTESLNDIYTIGVYDMVITYENEETDLKKSIVIKNFMELTR